MKKLDALTSLRFFAALAIVIVHSKDFFKSTSWLPNLPYRDGVSFFFVLSGFILTYSHRNIRSWQDARSFYVSRFARIWPLHIGTLLICALILPATQWFIDGMFDQWPAISLANIFLVHAWVPAPGYYFSFNSVSWSISTEMFFYLVFPAICYRWADTYVWKSAAIFAIAVAWLSISTAIGVPSDDFKHALKVSSSGFGYTSPVARMVEFQSGILMATVYFKWRDSAVGSFARWTVYEVIAIALVPVIWMSINALPRLILGHPIGDSPWSQFIDSSGAFPAFSVLILVMAFGRGAISLALAARPLVFLGEISFALYLVHQLYIRWYYWHSSMFASIPDVIQALVYWCTSVGSACLLYRFVEQPMRRLLRSKLLSNGSSDVQNRAPVDG